MEIDLEITKSGVIQMLHSDEVDLAQFGEVEVRRASHVEFADGSPSGPSLPKGWYVQSAATGDILKAGFPTRAEALAWEKAWFSPGGEGWNELTGGDMDGKVLGKGK